MRSWLDRRRVVAIRRLTASGVTAGQGGYGGPADQGVAALDDEAFLLRLPALRAGFDGFSPAGRLRFLEALADRLGRRPDLRLEEAPELLARWAEANRAGDAVVAALPPAPE